MNIDETAAVLAVLQTAYPQFYRTITRQQVDATIGLWAELFAEESFEVVKAAVKAYIVTDTKGFPPHIGAIKEAIRKLTQPEEMTEMEAWGHVAKALRNSGYHSAAEFEKLPPVVQRIVGSPSQLREWAMMDTDTVQSVVQSNFMRSYKARAAGERELLALPPQVREMMGGLAAGMAFPAPGESDRSYNIQQVEADIVGRYLHAPPGAQRGGNTAAWQAASGR